MEQTAKTSVGSRRNTRAPKASDIKAPKIPEERLVPASYAVDIDEVGETMEDTYFTVDKERLSKLHFTEPGQDLPKKRLFTVKAFSPSGVLVQLPFEDQIQNTAASTTQDAIGLRRYEQKGFHILLDYNTLQPVYCAAWGCWAQATEGSAFCSAAHMSYTLPGQGEAGQLGGLFSQNATTSKNVWS